MAIRPPSTLVAKHWLLSIARLSGRVARKLPADTSTWGASGFVTVGRAGGSPHHYLPLSSPVVSVHTWAYSENAANPPWHIAEELCEAIMHDTYGILDHANVRRGITDLPARYTSARADKVYPVTEPTEIPGDPGNYAHYNFSMAFEWVPI
jgi:hypothetical protein